LALHALEDAKQEKYICDEYISLRRDISVPLTFPSLKQAGFEKPGVLKLMLLLWWSELAGSPAVCRPQGCSSAPPQSAGRLPRLERTGWVPSPSGPELYVGFSLSYMVLLRNQHCSEEKKSELLVLAAFCPQILPLFYQLHAVLLNPFPSVAAKKSQEAGCLPRPWVPSGPPELRGLRPGKPPARLRGDPRSRLGTGKAGALLPPRAGGEGVKCWDASGSPACAGRALGLEATRGARCRTGGAAGPDLLWFVTQVTSGRQIAQSY